MLRKKGGPERTQHYSAPNAASLYDVKHSVGTSPINPRLENNWHAGSAIGAEHGRIWENHVKDKKHGHTFKYKENLGKSPIFRHSDIFEIDTVWYSLSAHISNTYPLQMSPRISFSWLSALWRWVICRIRSVLSVMLHECSNFVVSSSSGWWSGKFFIFPYIGNNNPNWRTP